MSRRRVALFGGTFDPPHLGHLNLALQIKEKRALDEVLFVPARANPLKSEQPIAPFEERVELLKLLIEGFDGLTVNTIEATREPPSYTIDTVKSYLSSREDIELFLILGEDQLATLTQWKNYKELFSLAKPLWGARPGINYQPTHLQELIKEGHVEINPLELSATEIRKRLKKRANCSDLLPSSLLDRIEQKALYL